MTTPASRLRASDVFASALGMAARSATEGAISRVSTVNASPVSGRPRRAASVATQTSRRRRTDTRTRSRETWWSPLSAAISKLTKSDLIALRALTSWRKPGFGASFAWSAAEMCRRSALASAPNALRRSSHTTPSGVPLPA